MVVYCNIRASLCLDFGCVCQWIGGVGLVRGWRGSWVGKAGILMITFSVGSRENVYVLKQFILSCDAVCFVLIELVGQWGTSQTFPTAGMEVPALSEMSAVY